MNKIILCFLCFFSVKAFSQCDLYLDAFKNGCDTSCTFYLEAIPSGVQPYSFQWSNQNFPDTFRLYNVCPGMYYCTFTDNNGCTSFDSIFLPTAPSFNLNLSYTEPSCPGCADGYASVNPVFGIVHTA
ncbi:MAG: hypothetical protein HY738_01475 [Bacteroidia bacterium]|nr:hypothetical protein [Bacteroidia bacterium]